MQIIKVKRTNKRVREREGDRVRDAAALLANSLDSSIPVDFEIILLMLKGKYEIKLGA